MYEMVQNAYKVTLVPRSRRWCSACTGKRATTQGALLSIVLRRLPAQGLGLVRDRLPRRAPARRSPVPPRRKPDAGADKATSRRRRPGAAPAKPAGGDKAASPAACTGTADTGTADLITGRRTPCVKKYLVAGLLVWLPLAITMWVLLWLLGVHRRRVRLAAARRAGGAAGWHARQPRAAASACPGWAWW
jgi:hypothetical protein